MGFRVQLIMVKSMESKCMPKRRHRMMERLNDEGESYSECEDCGKTCWGEHDLDDDECSGVRDD